MDKLTQLRFTIQRLDHYYNGINLKGTFFLGINTFLLGICFTSLRAVIVNQPEGILWLSFNFLAVVLCSLLSVVFVLMAILPFLKTGNSYDYESLVSFGSISKTGFKKFNSGVEEMDERSCQEDLSRQIHILSKGLKLKFIRIRNAGITLLLSIIAAIPFFYQILILT